MNLIGDIRAKEMTRKDAEAQRRGEEEFIISRFKRCDVFSYFSPRHCASASLRAISFRPISPDRLIAEFDSQSVEDIFEWIFNSS
jgi:hypothetical protein